MRTQKNKPKRLPKEALEAISSAEDLFSKAMYRPPQDYDRIFYWSYCYSEVEFKNLMIQTMLQAKIPEELIFIYDKTGFMVNEHGYKQLSKSEKREIEKAGKEYEKLSRKKEKIYKTSDYDSNHVETDDPLVTALYIFGNFIERNINSGERELDEQVYVISYLLVRAFRLIRALVRSKKYSTSEESLILLRSLYEIYCKTIYAISKTENAKYLLDSDFGLSTGEFEILHKDGKPKWGFLINKKTGTIIPRNQSFRKYIEESPFQGDRELFDVLYEYLSSFVHSGSRHVLKSWVDEHVGFTLTNEKDKQLGIFVSILTGFISATLMQALLKLEGISHIYTRDISLFCFATQKIIEEIGTPKNSEIALLLARIKDRAATLPNKVPQLKSNAQSEI
jgi:hypothetical protein